MKEISETTEHSEFALHENRRLCAIYTLTDSIRILFRNPKLFISISTLTIFPLSLLLFLLAFYSNPLKAQIYYLHAITQFSPSRVEVGHIWEKIELDSFTLIWLKALFWVPCYVLSLLAMVMVVNSTALACAGKRPNLQSAATAVRLTWNRAVVTSIYVFILMFIYVQLTRLVIALMWWSARARFLMVVLGAVLEVELMAVLSFAMVVSVLEERFGWEAVRVGWWLMEGRRFCGWVLSGFLVLVSGGAEWGLRAMMDGKDEKMVAVMGFVDKVGWIGLYGLLVLWSYVVYTIFYCECRTRRRTGRVESGSSSL